MRRPLLALALACALPVPVLAGQVVVREGESLSEIADRYGISVSRLIELNGIRNPDMVEAGSTLRLPGGSGGSSTRAGRSAGSGGGGGRSMASGGRIVVQDGDTLSEIASRHGVSMAALIKMNGLDSPDRVEAGRTLVVPGLAGGGGASGGAVRSSSRSSAAAPIAPPSYNPRAKAHVVRSGESLSTIADGYGIPLERLVALNSIKDPDVVIEGLRLRLKPDPVTPPAPPVRPRTVSRPSQPRPAAVATPRPRPVAPASVARRPQPASPAVASTRPAATPRSATLRSAAPSAVAVVVSSPRVIATVTPSPRLTPTASVALTSRSLTTSTQSSSSSTVRSAGNPASTASTPAPTSWRRDAGTTLASSGTTTPSSAEAMARAERPDRSTASLEAASTTTPRSGDGSSGTRLSSTAGSRSFATTALGSNGPVLARSSSGTTSLLSTARTSVAAGTTTAAAATTQTQASTGLNTATAMAARPDWRSYGPLQVDWANWQTMGGSLVAPVLASDGQSQYMAINCGARKMNATSSSGQWKSWADPRSDFEQQLLTDACKPRG